MMFFGKLGWPQPGRAERRLVGLGLALVPVYATVAILSWRFRYGQGHADRPILLVLTLPTLAWAGYAAALAIVLRQKDAEANGPQTSNTFVRMLIIIAFAVLFRLLLLPSNSIQEIDDYRYLWDGRVVLHGLNPYHYAPATIDREGPTAPPGSDLGRLWRIAHQSPAVRTIFERVHHRQVPTIYPPVAQAVFTSAVWLTPAEAPLFYHRLIIKSIIVLFDVGAIAVLVGLLVRVGGRPEWCLAYAWCPLVLKEFANSAHLDAIAVFFSVLSLFWLVATPDLRRGSDRSSSMLGNLRPPVLGLLALGLAVLAKTYPVVLLPVIGAFLGSRLRAWASVPLLGFLFVVILGYLPFSGETGPTSVASTETEGPWDGLGTYLARWEKNDFLFRIVRENLRAPHPEQSEPWFVLLPDAVRSTVDQKAGAWLSGLLGRPVLDPAFLLTQGLMGAVLGFLCLRWAWQLVGTPQATLLLRNTGLVLVWGWLLSSTPHPWYLTWALPFLVWSGRASWFLLPGLAMMYYLRFWFEYQALDGGWPAVQAALWRFDQVVVWFEFLPFFVVFSLESLSARRQDR